MATRNDITIDWTLSPRIITIDSPSVEVTMQDLYDTLRDAEEIQIDEPRIVSGAGKEPLGGGVSVGLTITLQNALLAFEARPGPNFTICRVDGGNLVAVDINGDPITPIHPTAYVQILLSSSSSATLTDSTLIKELHKLQGLNKDFPMTVTPTQRSVDDIDLTISGDGETVTVVTRQ